MTQLDLGNKNFGDEKSTETKIDRIYGQLLKEDCREEVKKFLGGGVHPDRKVFEGKEFNTEIMRFNQTRKMAVALSESEEKILDGSEILDIQKMIEKRVLKNLLIADFSTELGGAVALARLGARIDFWTPTKNRGKINQQKQEYGYEGNLWRGETGIPKFVYMGMERKILEGGNVFGIRGGFREAISKAIGLKYDLIMLNEFDIANLEVNELMAKSAAEDKASEEETETAAKKQSKGAFDQDKPYFKISQEASRISKSKKYELLDNFKLAVHFLSTPSNQRIFRRVKENPFTGVLLD